MRKTLFHSNNFHCKVIVIVICLSFSYQVLQAQPGRLTTSDLAKLARATIRDDYGFMCGFVNLSDSSLYSCDLIYLRKLSKDVVILDGTTCCPETNICQIDNLPPVSFTPYSLILTSSIKSVLRTVAARINENPGCNVRVTGYYSPSDKRSIQLGWDRVNTVIKYLTERQGISENRLIWNMAPSRHNNSVEFAGTNETGPTALPAPFPNYHNH